MKKILLKNQKIKKVSLITFWWFFQPLWLFQPPLLLGTKARFFYKQHFYKQHQADIGKKKIKQKLSDTLWLNIWFLKIIRFLHPRYHPKIVRNILKHAAKNKCVSFNELVRLMAMKIRLNKKNRSHRYDINRPRQRQGHKYAKYNMCLGIIMLLLFELIKMLSTHHVTNSLTCCKKL